ncbi:helix-turn-helix transcriptional regulator [Nonomuraea fuscirosea]|uniref:helix-turn-helix transcriptional regulator n=1 Tax=Nonomuraea fuscirosea TaxID=1291556 RepID=UPI0037B0F992
MSGQELADFLRRRRETLRPEAAGRAHGSGQRARRTPGLRREEVAARAQVSVSYYERLEQARASRPSPQVLDALATALQLTGAEREHLAGLAGQILPRAHRERERIPAEARALLDRLGAIPAYVVNSRQDIVAWNRAAVALITDFGLVPPGERNAVRLALRLAGTLCAAAPEAEATFARQSASQLRTAVLKHPADRALAELINEFAAHDADFAAGWRDHDVRPITAVRKRVNHPALGELELERTTLLFPGAGHTLVMYTAEPGSSSAAALERL